MFFDGGFGGMFEILWEIVVSVVWLYLGEWRCVLYGNERFGVCRGVAYIASMCGDSRT